MGNILYDIADNSFNTEYVAKSIVQQLGSKYNRDFEILKIGERYGTGNIGEVTALCSIKKMNDFIFRVKYDMIQEKIIEDNLAIRCTCYFLEKEIKKMLIDNKLLIRVELARKNHLDNIYKTEDFIKKYPNESFIATIIIENKKTNDYIKLLSEINKRYNNIKLNTIIYELSENEYKKFYEISNNIDELTMSYIESFSVKSRKILKIENGIVKFIE